MQLIHFQKAMPIWASGREKEKNCELAFRTIIAPGAVILRLAASTIYRVFVNAEFVAAGPARTSHGFYCVDELDLSKWLTEEQNVVVIEVVGFNVNSFDTLNQPSFLTAEFIQGEEIIVYTGDTAISAYELGERIQKVQRYSYQRAFAEAYRLRVVNQIFHKGLMMEHNPVACVIQEEKRYIMRNVRVPQYEVLQTQELLEIGNVDFDYICPEPIRDRSYEKIGNCLQGFKPNELDEQLSEEGQNMQFLSTDKKTESKFPLTLSDGYGLYSLPYNATGFLRFQVECSEDCIVYLQFDEILIDGKLDFLRMTSCNCFKYYLDAGTHYVMTFAPYTMKYVKLVIKGNATIHEMDMVEYKHPQVAYQVELPKDESLKLIYDAALETYLANAVDAFTDCPSRERAGWLCDSYFMARVEKVLTGESVLERAFLENFLRTEEFKHLPKGMLPMCYPADHYNGNFIPNWAMWFVLELGEYFERSGDRTLVDMSKTRIYDLLDYFAIYENQFGLLEGLKGWIFVEWSRANDDDVVQRINYPSNMIYMKMLQVIAKLYGDSNLEEKASKIKQVIRERSLKGIFYTDNEQKINNEYVNPENYTEVCQYYAFFTGVATKEEDATLWKILQEDFGYQRKETGLHPEVAFANAFIGNYLRIELLYRDGQYEEVLDNIRGYFIGMAKETGTLWEHDKPEASCNHGFASHVIYWLAGIYGTYKQVEGGTE